MNKKDLVAAIAQQCDTTQAAANEMVNAFTECVTGELKKGDGHKVVLPGFGQFVAKHRPSRQVRNPQTKEMMMSKAKTVAQFKPAIGLKDL